MSTFIGFTIDDLDADVKNVRPAWSNRTDYATVRSLALRKELAAYQRDRRDAAAKHVLADNFSTPIAIGTPAISLDTGDLYELTTPAGSSQVRGDYILLTAVITGAANDELIRVPRKELADILMPAETGPTSYAFFEENGVLVLYAKEGTLDAASNVSFQYERKLDATQTPTTTPLDIEPEYFTTLVSNVVQNMESYV